MSAHKERMVFHHVCIINTDYEKAMGFYVEQLGMEVHRASFSVHRGVPKIELFYDGSYCIELFIYPRERVESIREGQVTGGLEHVSFLVPDVAGKLTELKQQGVRVSQVNRDGDTGKEYGFCFDPDGQKIEFYQM